MSQPVIPSDASASDASASAPATGAVLRHGTIARMDPRTVYLLAKLRQDVFTLEQGATDADLDGQDLAAGTVILWIEVPGEVADAAGLEGEPAAHVRVLRGEDGSVHIGRLAVRAGSRRDGFGRRLMRAALDVSRELAPHTEVHISAQAHLEQWYLSMGYETVGERFVEAGIDHVPMVYRHPAP